MSVGSLLLRFVLSLALLVSGTSHADMAMAGMAGEHAGHVAAAVAAPPCHEAGETAADHAAHGAGVADGPAGDPLPDCCQAGSCRCACVHGLSATPVPGSAGFRPSGPQRHAEPGTVTYVSPSLPQLIRPPIV